MKIIKTALVLGVLAIIAFFTITWIEKNNPIEPISDAKNQFTTKIQQEINLITELPDNKFCVDFYNKVAYDINSWYSDGRLGINPSENEQWKNNLSENLYSGYTEKFIRQAFYVFNNHEWNPTDLDIIRSECKRLKDSEFLKNGPTDNKLSEINTILRKYDEVNYFISSCENFSYSGFDLSDKFPVEEVQNKFSKAANYLNNNLENQFVNNCTSLRERLNELRQSMFNAHVRYLDIKINQWSELYSNYNSQPAYADNLYKPIENEIKALDNDLYAANNFNIEKSRLTKKWEADAIRAYNYFNK